MGWGAELLPFQLFHVLNFCFFAYEEMALQLEVLKPLILYQGPFWLSHLLWQAGGWAGLD